MRGKCKPTTVVEANAVRDAISRLYNEIIELYATLQPTKS